MLYTKTYVYNYLCFCGENIHKEVPKAIIIDMQNLLKIAHTLRYIISATIKAMHYII